MRQKNIPALAMLVFLFMMFISTQEALSQCKSFVKTTCLPQLNPYIHDGNYHAVLMSEGEEAEVYKTVFAGQAYRLLICMEDQMPNVDFVISDIRRNILFDSRKNANVKVWDFKPEASQQIKVTIRIPKFQKQSNNNEQELIFGCVGILFSLMDQY